MKTLLIAALLAVIVWQNERNLMRETCYIIVSEGVSVKVVEQADSAMMEFMEWVNKETE